MSALANPVPPLSSNVMSSVSATPRMVHRPFFLAAIALTLTLGATWGVLLLWCIGQVRSIGGARAADVTAHGDAQIYGWVGLFIMGFAMQMFPRMWRAPAVSPRLAMCVLGLAVFGILLRAIGAELPADSAIAWPLAILGGACMIAGVSAFGVRMLEACERRRVPAEPAFLFMFVAIGWFILSSAFSVVLGFLALGGVESGAIANLTPALRDAQILGMAVTMILGVSLKILPGAFGLPLVGDRRAMLALALITLGAAGAASVSIAHAWTDVSARALAVYGGHVTAAIGIVMIVSKWRPCAAWPRDDGRGGKFVRAAYLWLLLSLLMTVAQPLHGWLVGVPGSHAFAGAARHAITVGFISMMIIGVASKIVPSLHGVPRRALSSLIGPFVLVNVGCALRVTLQSLTDVVPGAFNFLFLSGMLEVAGLAWWATDLTRLLLRRKSPNDFDAVPLTIRAQRETRACCSACACEE